MIYRLMWITMVYFCRSLGSFKTHVNLVCLYTQFFLLPPLSPLFSLPSYLSPWSRPPNSAYLSQNKLLETTIFFWWTRGRHVIGSSTPLQPLQFQNNTRWETIPNTTLQKNRSITQFTNFLFKSNWWNQLSQAINWSNLLYQNPPTISFLI